MNNANTRSGRHKKIKHPTKKPKNKKKRLLFKFFIGMLLATTLAVLAGAGVFVFYASKAPALSDERLNSTPSSKIYAKDKLIADLGAQQRVLFQANDIPQVLKDAVVSVEDKRFYQNIGVDPIRILGSFVHNLTHANKQGGSTLTQQLVKLSYFSTDERDQTLSRKAQEAWLAIQLDRRNSKEEILAYYMNKVYMANGIYGMKTAAENYYGDVKKLTLAQAALIAGMPQAPNTYNPYTNPKEAKYRRDVVLYTMLQNEKISSSDYDQAIAEPVTQGLKPLKNIDENLKKYDNYVGEVRNEVLKKTGKDIFKDGLNIYTNLDINAQKRLYDIVNTNKYVAWPDKKMQAAVTLIDVKTGAVKAQIGGRNYPKDTLFGTNQAVLTDRDFGSTMKPMADYGPAIEHLDWPTNHMLDDSPYDYPGTDIALHDWDNQFMGWMTMRKALTLSRNIPAVKTLEAVGLGKSNNFLKKLGINFKTLDYSNAITSNDGNVSSLTIAAAYATFANGGIYNEPYYVNKIVFEDGTEQAFQTEETHRAMKASTAYMITDMLKNVISSGTGNNAEIPGLFQAGKTGTSNYTEEELKKINSPYEGIAPDENFVGFTPHYSIGVWTGYKNRMNPLTPDDFLIASEIYKALMEYVSDKVSNKDWVMPNTVMRDGTELRLINSDYIPQYVAPVSTTDSESKESTTTTTMPSKTSSSSSSKENTSASISSTTASETQKTSSSTSTTSSSKKEEEKEEKP